MEQCPSVPRVKLSFTLIHEGSLHTDLTIVQATLWHSCLEYLPEINPGPAAAASSPVDPLELWEALAIQVLQTSLPKASVIALGFLTSQYSWFPHKQLLRTQHCLCVLKVIIQILTWACPGVQALFGPSQQDFCQPPPQSAVGTRLPPFPVRDNVSHG